MLELIKRKTRERARNKMEVHSSLAYKRWKNPQHDG